MRNLKIKNSTRNLFFTTAGIETQFDSGRLDMRDGTQPADADTAATGVSRALVDPLPPDAFGAPVDGSMAKAGTWEDASVAAGGTPTWFRLDNGVGSTERIDGSIGLKDDIKETSGATTSFGANTATDTSLVMTADEHAGRHIRMTSGPGDPVENEIISHTAGGVFTLRKNWITQPNPNDPFVVVERYDLELTTLTTVTGDKVVIDTFVINLDLHDTLGA